MPLLYYIVIYWLKKTWSDKIMFGSNDSSVLCKFAQNVLLDSIVEICFSYKKKYCKKKSRAGTLSFGVKP